MPESGPATDLDALERFVLDAEDLTALESLVGKFNVFHALGIARAEIRHSNALAWLLDPGESHALGDLFLKPVVMDLLRQADRGDRPLSPAELDGTDLNRTLVYRERKHIDLTIHSADPPFVIAIENKIDAKEHSGQLGRYSQVLQSDFAGVPALRVFLTPDGDEPGEDGWVAYSYADLHAALTRTRRLHAGSIGGDVGVFIDHYLGLIGSELMDDPKIDELCQRIYRNHKRAIDLIVERTNAGGDELVRALKSVLEEEEVNWHIYSIAGKRAIFVPKPWLDWIPPVGFSPDEPRSWVRLYFTESYGWYRILFQIEQTTDSEIREAFVSRLADGDKWTEFSRTSRGTGRVNRLWSRRVINLAEVDDMDADDMIAKIREGLGAFERDALGVDEAGRAMFPSPGKK